MKTLCTLIVTAVALVAAAPAAAGVEPAGTGEPLFTNSAGNTQWFEPRRAHWNGRLPASLPLLREQRAGARGHGLGAEQRHHLGQLVRCQDAPGGQPYGICVQGEYSFPNDSLYFSDGPNSCSMGTMTGKRSHTTIDRTKPTVSVTAAGGADSAKHGSVPVSIGFQDATAGPFPATFVCVEAGTGPCEGQHAYSAPCSQPSSPCEEHDVRPATSTPPPCRTAR